MSTNRWKRACSPRCTSSQHWVVSSDNPVLDSFISKCYPEPCLYSGTSSSMPLLQFTIGRIWILKQYIYEQIVTHTNTLSVYLYISPSFRVFVFDFLTIQSHLVFHISISLPVPAPAKSWLNISLMKLQSEFTALEFGVETGNRFSKGSRSSYCQQYVSPMDGWEKFSRKHTTGFTVIALFTYAHPVLSCTAIPIPVHFFLRFALESHFFHPFVCEIY